MVIPVYQVTVPEYNILSKPNYLKIGKKVDRLLEENLSDGVYIIRAISSDDHEINLDELTKIIIEKGTDKYDEKRKPVCHKEFSSYDYDIQASKLEIKNSKLVIPSSYKYQSEFGDIVYHFYEHTPFDRGYSLRIDLLLVYDFKKLKKAKKYNPESKGVRKGLNNYLYKFKDPKRKKEALIAVFQILR